MRLHLRLTSVHMNYILTTQKQNLLLTFILFENSLKSAKAEYYCTQLSQYIIKNSVSTQLISQLLPSRSIYYYAQLLF